MSEDRPRLSSSWLVKSSRRGTKEGKNLQIHKGTNLVDPRVLTLKITRPRLSPALIFQLPTYKNHQLSCFIFWKGMSFQRIITVI